MTGTPRTLAVLAVVFAVGVVSAVYLVDVPRRALAAGDAATVPDAAQSFKTVTLRVAMTCPSCPYIVRSTLERVAGVKSVDVIYERQIAVVSFDSRKTDVATLTAATAAVGFPSEAVAD